MIVFLVIGLCAGVVSGMFGVGGGILIVPALLLFAKFRPELALGTSLGVFLLPVGVLGAYTYYRNGNINVGASLVIGLGLFFGAWIGARLAHMLSVVALQRMFAAFMTVAAIQLWREAGR